MDNNKSFSLSVVATCYNDCDIIPVLVKEIEKNLIPLTTDYEIILVNDSSTDNSEKVIEKICSENSKVKGISLSRNFGQQIAMSAGIRYAKGDYIVIMDGDLQNPPAEIPRLYNEIIKGYDIVYTVSKNRNNFFDRLTSSLFWFILTRLLGVKIVRNQLMLRIMNRSFVNRYNEYNEINRTVEGIVVDISGNYSIIHVENQQRAIGRSHYSFFKRTNLMIDMLISLTNVPLNMMLYFGWIVLLLTIISSAYNLIAYLFFDVPAGFTSIILSIFLFGSLIILLLGFIGRYLSNIYVEVRRRPLFHVKTTFNVDKDE